MSTMSIGRESTLTKSLDLSTLSTLKRHVTLRVSRTKTGADLSLPSCADFQPCNSYSLATLKVVVDSFRDIYPINNKVPVGQPLAVGRYPEDTYYGGNPWYLCTLAVAEFLYDAVAQFEKAEILTIDEIDLAFFRDIYPSAATGPYEGKDLKDVLDSMTTYADGFVSVVQVISLLTLNTFRPTNQYRSNILRLMDPSPNKSTKRQESLSLPTISPGPMQAL
jgi:Glycosyl hydrolases family 15